ncbi:RNA recognition motif. (a.k.a. RRM, RBD, or RNP domain) [uncultured archaeon]|nr:RNA recognition motif. (a.k.a. RRM, RBD, or RNP domain) [uncultured archaeon]
MGNKLFVGNLPYSVTQEQLKDMFTSYGEITEALVVMDRLTGRSKGFGFVTFADETACKNAMTEMNGKDVEGKALTVNEARQMGDRPKRSFGGDRHGGSGGGDYGDRPRRSFNNRY